MKIKAKNAGTLHDQGKGWTVENIKAYQKRKEYRDKTICWVTPSLGMFPDRVVSSWEAIQWPMNQPRTGRISLTNMEVGEAYEELFRSCIEDDAIQHTFGGDSSFAKTVKRCNFVLTLEHDNIIPPNAVNDLFYAIYTCIDCGEEMNSVDDWHCPNGHPGIDAVGGLYWTKSEPGMPMAYGDPKAEGELAEMLNPVDIAEAIDVGAIIEVGGIAMGCSLFRKASVEKVSHPWFWTQDNGTQDMLFCSKAKKEAGLRFAVHCGVRVGHMDITTREIF